MSSEADVRAPKWRLSTKAAITWVLAVQLGIALLLMGRDILAVLPEIAMPSQQPRFDAPVHPGDQRRRYSPGDIPLAPPGDGNPARPFRSTGDMPSRLAFELNEATLSLTGSIAEGDAGRLRDYLGTGAREVARVRLNSPGGSVRDALEIGRMIRARGLDAALEAGDICLSACPYLLAAGVARSVDEQAQVGVHQHYFGANTALPAFLAVADIQRGQGEVMAYLDEMGIDPLVMQHALTTPPDEIYVLLPEELSRYRLVLDGTP